MRRSAGTGLCLLLMVPTSPALASDKGWAHASDIGRDALVAAVLVVPAVEGDWTGVAQAGGSIAAAAGTTYVLKELVRARRPDGSDDRSFPSGHTSVSFAAAATLEKRYGWHAGLPAFAVAGFVGVGRVEARKHHWYDVAAGAVLGTASGFLLNHSPAGVRLVPWADSKGGGISVATRF